MGITRRQLLPDEYQRSILRSAIAVRVRDDASDQYFSGGTLSRQNPRTQLNEGARENSKEQNCQSVGTEERAHCAAPFDRD
jgi:hypothetical protein